ncbi:MAG: branched-chain amino acid transporter permease [Rhodospirillales bacterium]|nr:branched-chain amino acid transporter permease [Rhodospirillales bacterium]
MIGPLVNILINGLAYGVLLFLMAGGLSVTMGLMGFANLAHGSLAMLGGYIVVGLMRDYHWPFLLTLPAAAIGAAIAGWIVERTIFKRFYGGKELDQVLLTIGIVSMTVAIATYVWGSTPQPVRVPEFLDGRVHVGIVDVGTYRLFLILLGGLLTLGLVLGIERTTFGAKIRAAVDNRRMTVSCGINVDRLFTLAFAIGSALAGLGGGLAVYLVGLDPSFPVKYLVYLLIVVVVGGLGSIQGTLLAAIALGICDVAGKYYVPEAGAFVLYAVTVLLLLWRPQGIFGR